MSIHKIIYLVLKVIREGKKQSQEGDHYVREPHTCHRGRYIAKRQEHRGLRGHTLDKQAWAGSFLFSFHVLPSTVTMTDGCGNCASQLQDFNTHPRPVLTASFPNKRLCQRPGGKKRASGNPLSRKQTQGLSLELSAATRTTTFISLSFSVCLF